ncbi:MAG: MFS transporter [Burkholderiales bacterium]|jgi:MFS family permease|nr:MFS transporter [Burkholderiales bacterium]
MFSVSHPPKLKSILIASGLIISLAMGVRHGFGFWLQPISQAHNWTRETYSMAMAIQNIMWGLFGPLAGIAADKLGVARIVLIGAALYVAGLLCMSFVDQPTLFIISTGVLIGAALSCTAFGPLSGIVGRSTTVSERSWAFGILGAAGSFGQFMMIPAEQQLIALTNWQDALQLLAVAILIVMLPMAFLLREPPHAVTHHQHQQSLTEAIQEAFSNRSFRLLICGYFVCGFQVVFIGVHLPAYLKDAGLADPSIAVMALALIGLFNIFGSFYAGKLGGTVPKRYLLSGIYFARAVFILIFILAPLSAFSVYVFAAFMGLLWLSTVPLTNGVIAGIFGVRHLSMLSGFVFFSHQLGSFLGVWLGGYLYTLEGNYNTVWMITIGLGIFAGCINLPINEDPITRQAPSLA